MKTQKLLKLINKDIDNELTPGEKVLLENEIANNPDSAKLYNDLTKISRLLDEAPSLLNEKVDVTNEVFGKIDKTKYLPGKGRSKLRAFFSSFTVKKPAIAYAFGILTGIIILAIAFSSGVIGTNEPGISGTITDADSYAGFSKAGEIDIKQFDVTAAVNAQMNDQLVICSLNFNSSEKYRIEVNFNEADLKLYSIKPVSINQLSNFTTTGSSVLFNNKGENKYMILFKNDISSGGTEGLTLRLISESGQAKEYLLPLKTHN